MCGPDKLLAQVRRNWRAGQNPAYRRARRHVKALAHRRGFCFSIHRMRLRFVGVGAILSVVGSVRNYY